MHRILRREAACFKATESAALPAHACQKCAYVSLACCVATENWMERHKILTGIGAATAAGAGYEIYEHEKQKYDERRQQGAPPPQGGEPQRTLVPAGISFMWAVLYSKAA